MAATRYALWGSELSPFSLKVALLCRYAGLPVRELPADGGLLENLRALARVTAVRHGWRRPRFPVRSDFDELPLVPYLLGSRGEVLFDSSAIAEWLDDRPAAIHPRLLPASGASRFAARLLDEYFDEMGLYFAHHNRWVLSASTNDAGTRLAREFRTLVPRPLRRRFAERFAARQVRRLPYLFSVAAAEPERYDLPSYRRPPGRAGFPPTDDLLDSCFRRMLDRLDGVYQVQPFLLGERFSVADASMYGQLAMNMSDPTAAATIELRAAATTARVRVMATQGAELSTASHEVRACLVPLLEEIGATFLPLMQQNEAAYEAAHAAGARIFNERAFDRGAALYDGVLAGRPYRSVVKTFQVGVWRRLKAEWRGLHVEDRAAFPFTIE
jgi:glutathione S-transferase